MERQTEIYTNPCWVKTYDALGIRPRNPVVCPMCFARNMHRAIQEGKLLAEVEAPEMFIRRSHLHPVPDVRAFRGTNGHKPWAFDTVMKCPRCDFYCVFGVPTDLEYALEVQKLRGDKFDFFLPDSDWMDPKKTDAETQKKLEALGYV